MPGRVAPGARSAAELPGGGCAEEQSTHRDFLAVPRFQLHSCTAGWRATSLHGRKIKKKKLHACSHTCIPGDDIMSHRLLRAQLRGRSDGFQCVLPVLLHLHYHCYHITTASDDFPSWDSYQLRCRSWSNYGPGTVLDMTCIIIPLPQQSCEDSFKVKEQRIRDTGKLWNTEASESCC